VLRNNAGNMYLFKELLEKLLSTTHRLLHLFFYRFDTTTSYGFPSIKGYYNSSSSTSFDARIS